MIKSMTGFGRGEAAAGRFRVSVEIRSVNHRHVDFKFRLPPELVPLEPALGRRLKSFVQRGRVDVTTTIARDAGKDSQIEVNADLVKAYLAAARRLGREFSLPGDVRIQEILALPDAVRMRATARDLSAGENRAMMTAFEKAARAHRSMRVKEGSILARDIKRRVAAIDRLRKRIDKQSHRMLADYVKRLRGRIRQLAGAAGGGAVSLDEARLAQEVALLADRSDITEELVRLAGYVEQVQGLLAAPDQPVGKKLDFIMQEMNREANTINSKAIELGICQAALEVKSEVEKIREQVQNIE